MIGAIGALIVNKWKGRMLADTVSKQAQIQCNPLGSLQKAIDGLVSILQLNPPCGEAIIGLHSQRIAWHGRREAIELPKLNCVVRLGWNYYGEAFFSGLSKAGLEVPLSKGQNLDLLIEVTQEMLDVVKVIETDLDLAYAPDLEPNQLDMIEEWKEWDRLDEEDAVHLDRLHNIVTRRQMPYHGKHMQDDKKYLKAHLRPHQWQ